MKRQKVLVIGIDGMDPGLLETFCRKGELPAFSRLLSSVAYRRLATTDPPQSPVAWESFIRAGVVTVAAVGSFIGKAWSGSEH